MQLARSAVRLCPVLLLGLAVAGCGNRPASPAGGKEAATLSARTIQVCARELLLEVHLYPQKPLGAARLAASGAGVRVVPASFAFPDLKPPPAPDTSRSPPNPYPLPRRIIRIFRVTAADAPPSRLTVTLAWSAGRVEIEVPWPAPEPPVPACTHGAKSASATGGAEAN